MKPIAGRFVRPVMESGTEVNLFERVVQRLPDLPLDVPIGCDLLEEIVQSFATSREPAVLGRHFQA